MIFDLCGTRHRRRLMLWHKVLLMRVLVVSLKKLFYAIAQREMIKVPNQLKFRNPTETHFLFNGWKMIIFKIFKFSERLMSFWWISHKIELKKKGFFQDLKPRVTLGDLKTTFLRKAAVQSVVKLYVIFKISIRF